MLVTASTIKDSMDNVRFFVAANLASGIDHMFVFVDAPRDPGQDEVAAFLEAHPQVTCVRTGRGQWWQGERPHSLNTRQRINANWVRAVLEPVPAAEWLFHIDGDEVAAVDRAVLAGVPPELDAVWLPPWEAVSQWEASGRPTRFKRLLDDAELNLLHVLGAIDEPTNQAYFHGHVLGKSGVRPRSGLGLTLHEPVTPDARPASRFESRSLRVLHYDGPSGEEFVRKWTALADAGPARYRPSRAPAARAARALIQRDLPDEVRATYLRRLYERTMRDDVELLGDLGLLETTDPLAAAAEPRPLPDGVADQLAARVEELRGAPKAGFLAPDPVVESEGRAGGATGALRRRLRRPH